MNKKIITAQNYKSLCLLIINASKEELSGIDQIGEVIAESFVKYFENPSHRKNFDDLLEVIDIIKEEVITGGTLMGKTVVVTGSLEMFENRNALKDAIEAQGGKVSGSVSANTFILVNNDINSTSSKNKSAKSLGIPIMTEKDFVTQYLK